MAKIPGEARGREVAIATLLFLTTLAAYWPSLGGGFIWNDSDYVTAPALRSWSGLAAIWTQPGATQQYYPLLHSAFWVEHRLWGDQALGYRLVTLACHFGAALLFAVLLRRLAVPGAWLAAFLFALHPVHVESVAWITEQKNTLSLVFYLAAALAYVRFDETRGRGAWWAALGLFVLSLLCKTVTATLPAALLVVFWWKRGRLSRSRDVAPLLPWFALGIAGALFTSWVERHYVGAEGENFTLTLAQRGLVAGRAIWFYLGKLAWPSGLNFIYPRWTLDAAVWWQWLFPLGVLVVAGGLWWLRRRTRAPLAVFLLFTGSLFPVLGVVSLYGALYSFVWDHWQYLPDLAPLALLAAGLAWAGGRWLPRRRWLQVGAAAGLLAVLGGVSYRHQAMFQDEETLYRLTLAKNPAAWMAHNNLGNLLAATRGREREAAAHYRETIRLRPAYAEAYHNLALVQSQLPDEAGEVRANLETALRLKPDYAAAHYLLASVLAAEPATLADAIRHDEEAVRLEPDYAEAHYYLGLLLARDPARRAEARGHFEAAVRANPGLSEAQQELGRSLLESPGREGEAIAHLEAALRGKPSLAPAHLALGTVLAEMPGRLPEAMGHFEAALRLDPADPQAHFNLAIALIQSPGRMQEAVPHLQAVLQARPGDAQVHFYLGNIFLETPGREREARAHYEAALRLDPGFAPAREMLDEMSRH